MSKTEFKLKHPYESNGETIKAVSLRMATVSDMLTVSDEKNAEEKLAKMTANLLDMSPNELGGMSLPDYTEIAKKVASYFPS